MVMPWVSTQNSWKGDVQTNTQSWMFIAAQFTPSVHSQMMDKCHMVPPHMEAFLSPEKGRSPNTCYHVDGPWEDDAQWEKQTQKHTQGVIPLMGNVQNRSIHRHREWVPGCQGLGEGMGWQGQSFWLRYGDIEISNNKYVFGLCLCSCHRAHQMLEFSKWQEI